MCALGDRVEIWNDRLLEGGKDDRTLETERLHSTDGSFEICFGDLRRKETPIHTAHFRSS
jgi:hypothetical protein